MLRKLKTLLIVGVAALSIAFAAPVVKADPPTWQGPGYYQKVHGNSQNNQIKYFSDHPSNQSEWVFIGEGPVPPNGGDHCFGGSCGDAFAHAFTSTTVVNPAVIDDDNPMGWSTGGGEFTLEAAATAMGKDGYFLFWKIRDGEATAWVAIEDTTLKTRAIVLSTGEKTGTGGLSTTLVLGSATLDVNASAFAQGNFGCLQEASVTLSGDLTVGAGGHALSTSVNGSGSQTWGSGETVVSVEGSDYDSEKYAFKWWIFPVDPTAMASLEGKVKAKQNLWVTAYVSADGQTTLNYGMISGGSAVAFGDIDITDVTASGIVQQEAQAVGPGAVAYGSSIASYTNAGGEVGTSRWSCNPTANADGLAIVTGYNNITHSGDQLTINSYQSAFATTK